MKVLPFESGGQSVKYEVTQVADLNGRLTGHGIGSNYVQQAADGTSTTKFYGAFTTTEGETILAEAGGMSVPHAWASAVSHHRHAQDDCTEAELAQHDGRGF